MRYDTVLELKKPDASIMMPGWMPMMPMAGRLILERKEITTEFKIARRFVRVQGAFKGRLALLFLRPTPRRRVV